MNVTSAARLESEETQLVSGSHRVGGDKFRNSHMHETTYVDMVGKQWRREKRNSLCGDVAD